MQPREYAFQLGHRLCDVANLLRLPTTDSEVKIVFPSVLAHLERLRAGVEELQRMVAPREAGDQ